MICYTTAALLAKQFDLRCVGDDQLRRDPMVLYITQQGKGDKLVGSAIGGGTALL